MGYFNYFIKCIIRNLAYKLCKPKVLVTILAFVAILFALHTTGYCAWTDGEIEDCLNSISTITSNQGVIISQLSSMGVDVSDIEILLNSANTTLSSIKNDTSNIATDIDTLLLKIESINTTLTELCEQQNIYYESVTSELQLIKDALVGSEATPVTAQSKGVVTISSASGTTPGVRMIYIPMEYKYTYKITVTYTNSSSSDIYINYLFSSVDATSNQNVGGTLSSAGKIPANSTSSFTLTTRDYTKPYLYMTYGYNYSSISVTGSIEGIVDIIDRTNQEIADNLEQGNQLQQESNQLQQEQNDFLKQEQSDDDVSVDSFNSVDANDITSEGLTGIFTNIYNSIINWSSKDINLPIPYTNKSIVIPANYTQNMLSSFGGDWIISFISAIYYFIVARFIIYSITNIINSIKSGSILETDSKNNITTDML